MHFWSVWHEGRDFDHYRDVSPRFCSEFGFQSYPSMTAIRRFCDPADFNIAAPVLESHQKNEGGNARIAETMFRYFRWPAAFEDFVYLSQVQQGLAIKTAVTQWRGLKPHCMGTLYWQLNDTWPVCSWASLDHGGDWKLLHHMAKDFFAPVSVVVIPEGDRLVLRGVNDTPGGVTLTVEAYAAAMDGATRPLGKASGAVGDTAVDLMAVALSDLGPNEVLALVWSGPDGLRGGDVFAPRPWKSYSLEDPALAHAVTRDGTAYKIKVEATKAAAFYVAVEADVAGRFSDAAFALFPGHPTTITFTPADPAATPEFTLRDLYRATTA
jgi:beta-mannosidase